MRLRTPGKTILALCSAAVISATGYVEVTRVPVASAATSPSTSLKQAENAATTASKTAVADQNSAKAKARTAAALSLQAKTAVSQANAAKAVATKAAAAAKANPTSKVLAATAKTKAEAAKRAVAKASSLEVAAKKALLASKHAVVIAVKAEATVKADEAVVTKLKSQTSSTTVKAQKYKDGTYVGVGTTNIGSVRVEVTLKGDKFTRVQITGYDTHYPISYINPTLPNQLMQTQDINKVDVVSGATLSSEDFYLAVQQCLKQAQN